MVKRRLPIGIQTFREVREENYYYVDKTAFIEQLVAGGKYYFLSRPRRFGKSLFLDTLKELFEGSEKLFKGLRIHPGWTWGEPNPVVRLDFAGGDYRQPKLLEDSLMELLAAEERRHEVEANYRTVPGRFAHLLEVLHQRSGRRVVVLVDEYDKPILDMLGTPPVASANRDILRNVYGVIKASDARIRFTLLTGVSKFSKVNLFSQLNNLIDLTLEPAYSSICGYTERDLDTVFAPELEGLDRDEVRDWYNGYSWLGKEKVYNPFDVLLLLRRRTFDAHWFETGSPAFLIDTLFKRRVSSVSLEEMEGTERLLSAFDVEHISTEALLFQTGYLTITEKKGSSGISGEGGPDLEEEVVVVAEPVGHSLDHLDLVVDAFDYTGVQRPVTVRQYPVQPLLHGLRKPDQWRDPAVQRPPVPLLPEPPRHPLTAIVPQVLQIVPQDVDRSDLRVGFQQFPQPDPVSPLADVPTIPQQQPA